MTTLCGMFCPDDLKREIIALHTSQNKVSQFKNSIDAIDRDEDEEGKGINDDRQTKRAREKEEIGGDIIKPEAV